MATEFWNKEELVHNEMDAMVNKAVDDSEQRKVRVIYSAYKTDKDDVPINNLNEIAATGKVVLIAPRNEFYGGKDSRSYKSPVLENPTWLQVCVYANEMITTTKDKHHVFLEGLDYKKKEGDVKVFEFCMGS